MTSLKAWVTINIITNGAVTNEKSPFYRANVTKQSMSTNLTTNNFVKTWSICGQGFNVRMVVLLVDGDGVVGQSDQI